MTPYSPNAIRIEIAGRTVAHIYEIHPVMAKWADRYDYEQIVVDNGSTDGTLAKLRELAAKDTHLKIIANVRNFGHIRSPYYGILQAHGDAVIYLASDMQDPPELIGPFLEAWQEGYENKLKKEYLGKLKEKYKDVARFTEYDITQEGNHFIFMETAKAYGLDEKKLGYPAAAIGSTFLIGYPDQIGSYAENAIEKAQMLSEKTIVRTTPISEEQTEQAFKKITFWAIISAGLVDGINPCAFAVIVFFISFLTVYKYNRREILVVGVAYCVAVFLAYLLLGIGVFKCLYALRGFAYVIKTFYILTAGLCLVCRCLANNKWPN